jgi:hypothetical protein
MQKGTNISTHAMQILGGIGYTDIYPVERLLRDVRLITDVPARQGVQGFDRYAYGNNNPLRYNDPTGHAACSGLDDDECKTPIVENLAHSERKLEDSGPITDFILQLPGSTEDWSNLATGLDVLAWLTDIYAAGTVTYAGFAGAALPAPLIAAGLPEVPLATGLAGMAIAELYIQPVLFTGNVLASLGMGATLISDTKAGNTRIEDSKYSISVLNSMALTDIGWMSNEAYLSLIIQSVSVANDMGWTSLPFPTIP